MKITVCPAAGARRPTPDRVLARRPEPESSGILPDLTALSGISSICG